MLPNGIRTSVIAWQNENLNRLPLGQTREKNIALSEYNKNTSSRIDDYNNEQILTDLTTSMSYKALCSTYL